MSTTITINTHEVSRRECAALIVLLNALHPSAAAEPTAPTVTTGFDAQKCREVYEDTYCKVAAALSYDLWEYVWKKAHGVEAIRPMPGFDTVPRVPSDMTTPEITALLADLNAELYSRRVIEPEDNPAAGVELPAASVAGMDDTIDAGDNLASIFGAAECQTDANDLAGYKEQTRGEPVNMGGAQLDKNGLPWDSRIHAASKAINADGTWRQKRGVAPELVAAVEAQLRGVMAVPVPDTHGSPELDADAAKLEAMDGDAGPKIGDIGEFATGGTIAPLPPQSVGALEANLRVNRMPPPQPTAPVLPPPPPVATPPNDPTTFPELVAYITAQKVAGKLTQAQLDAALQIIGVQGALPVMAARPDLIPALVAKLRVAAGG